MYNFRAMQRLTKPLTQYMFSFNNQRFLYNFTIQCSILRDQVPNHYPS